MECESASKRLLELTCRVKESEDEIDALGKLSADSRTLEVICETSIRLSKELNAHLDDLKVDPKSKSKKRKSFRQALKSVCSKKKVDGLARKLQMTRDELNIHLVELIVRKADLLALHQEQALTGLREGARKTVNAVLESQALLNIELGHQSKFLIESTAKNQECTVAPILRALCEAQKVEIRLLQSLQFLGMDDRHVQIAETHRRTFRWVLDRDGQENATYSNFVEWLERGSGMYWINGKAGSGKSTLMRFTFDEATTRDYLSIWAEGKELEIAGFFFWMSGSNDQRSHSGLLRSLLYQALHKSPDLVWQIFLDEWPKSKRTHSREFDINLSSGFI